jgi:hypothetical protein
MPRPNCRGTSSQNDVPAGHRVCPERDRGHGVVPCAGIPARRTTGDSLVWWASVTGMMRI